LVETDYQRGANAWYARVELAQKSGHELVLGAPALEEKLFDVGAYTIGYVRDLKHNGGAGVTGHAESRGRRGRP
jgi:hypothetical protein